MAHIAFVVHESMTQRSDKQLSPRIASKELLGGVAYAVKKLRSLRMTYPIIAFQLFTESGPKSPDPSSACRY